MRTYNATLAVFLAMVVAAVIVIGVFHRDDRSLICKEQVINGQVYANACVGK